MFYRDLVQNLKAWQVRPPQIRTEAAIADGSDPPSAPDLLPLTPADHMLPAPANGDAPDDDAAGGLVSEPLPESPFQGSIQGSVLSKIDPDDPDTTPATTGNPAIPDPPWATS
ncbi:MAG: hypothetical protein WAN93_05380 [Solirubrobacteraceae bacterium]